MTDDRIAPGTRVRFRRDAKDAYTGRTRRWAAEARHGTVVHDFGLSLTVKFDVHHAHATREVFAADIEVLA